MKIFLSLICLISFAFSSNMVFSKYSKDFLEKNVLPGLQNEGLKIYYVNCYDKLVYSDDEISNNGWVIPEECNMFKYPIKSSIDNKILQIGNINKDKISLLKEQINKIKEKEIETQTKLEKDFKTTSNNVVTENINNKTSNDGYYVLTQLKLFIIMVIVLLIFYIIYKKYSKGNQENNNFNITVNDKEINDNQEKVENNEIDLSDDLKIEDNLNKIIEERIISEENKENTDEECEENDEECICRKYNIRFKKERNLNV